MTSNLLERRPLFGGVGEPLFTSHLSDHCGVQHDEEFHGGRLQMKNVASMCNLHVMWSIWNIL